MLHYLQFQSIRMSYSMTNTKDLAKLLNQSQVIFLIKISQLMKWTERVGIIAIILASLYMTVDWNAVKKSVQWGEQSRIYLYSNSIKGPYTFGFVINGSLLQMSYYSAFKICKLEAATYVVYNIFDVIPKHQFFLDDPNIAVAKALDGDMAFYLLVNGTKWKFTGGQNSTYNYGIDNTKVVYTSYNYLDSFPTTYYLY